MVYFMEIKYISGFLKSTPYSNIGKLNESKTVVTSIIHKKYANMIHRTNKKNSSNNGSYPPCTTIMRLHF